jgi:protein MpaA
MKVALLLMLGATGMMAVHPGVDGARHVMLGRSVRGRPIVAVELGDPHSKRKVLVVGCIHGNECAGLAIVRALERRPAPPGVDLWIVENLNPDGYAGNTRQNARGVDLNRNFPTGWRPLSGIYDSGPHPLSEPESRIAYHLMQRLHPVLSLWFHQHLQVVDDSSGNRVVERRFARLVGLPVRPLAQEPGSATTWESRRFPAATSFVVELGAGALSPAQAGRYARAIDAVARA